MVALEQLSLLIPAFIDFNEEFKVSTSAREEIKNIVGKGIGGKLGFVELKIVFNSY
jgi:hypothetical protein